MSETRELREIAREIDLEWRHPYFGAVPYIVAMRQLTTIDSNYFEDDAKRAWTRHCRPVRASRR